MAKAKGTSNYKSYNTNSRLYRIWHTMKSRCNNPNRNNYYLYGGRGITVCDEWATYAPFRQWSIDNGYNDSLTLDRINNDCHYGPDNCRWVNHIEQANNRRNNHVITINNETKTIMQFCRQYNIPKPTFYRRLREGWEIEDAILIPTKRYVSDGHPCSLRELSLANGLPYQTIHRRVKYLGWPIEKALTTPVR